MPAAAACCYVDFVTTLGREVY